MSSLFAVLHGVCVLARRGELRLKAEVCAFHFSFLPSPFVPFRLRPRPGSSLPHNLAPSTRCDFPSNENTSKRTSSCRVTLTPRRRQPSLVLLAPPNQELLRQHPSIQFQRRQSVSQATISTTLLICATKTGISCSFPRATTCPCRSSRRRVMPYAIMPLVLWGARMVSLSYPLYS